MGSVLMRACERRSPGVCGRSGNSRRGEGTFHPLTRIDSADSRLKCRALSARYGNWGSQLETSQPVWAPTPRCSRSRLPNHADRQEEPRASTDADFHEPTSGVLEWGTSRDTEASAQRRALMDRLRWVLPGSSRLGITTDAGQPAAHSDIAQGFDPRTQILRGVSPSQDPVAKARRWPLAPG